MKQRIIDFFKFCYVVLNRFYVDGCFYRAAALAYTTLLSLVPLMVVSFTILAAFPEFKEMGQKLQDLIFANFVAASAQVVQAHLQSFVQHASQLSATGILSLLVMAVLMVFSMEQAFNSIWHVKKRRHGVQAFLMYWAVITLTPILLGVGLAVSSYLIADPLISGATEYLGLNKVIWVIAPYITTYVAFTLVFVAVPNCKVYVRYAAVGALVSTILFELAKWGFAIYVTRFPTYRLLYGAVATVPLFLIWLYVSWVVVLFGVVVNHQLSIIMKKQSSN